MKTIELTVQAKELQNLLKTSKLGIVTSLLLGMVLIFAERNIPDPQILLLWFAVLVMVSAVRLAFIVTYQRTAATNPIIMSAHLRNIRIGTFISGMVWGSAGILLFFSNDFTNLIFLIFILAGLTAGNTVSNASDLPGSIGFSILALSPVTVNLFLNETYHTFYMGMALAIYLGFLIVIGRYINVNMTKSTILQYKAEASEKEALRSEERYRLILKHAPAGILHYNRDLVITYCNDRFAQVLNAPKEKLIGLDMNTLKDQSIVLSLKKAIDGQEGSYEGKYTSTISNTELWLIVFYAPLYDTYNTIEGGIAIIEDITDRKMAEEEMQKLLNNLMQAEKIAHIGNWHLDLCSNKLDWSDEIFHIFELDKETFEPSYDAFLNIIHPDDREKVADAYQNSLQMKQKYETTHRLLMKDGRIKYVNEQCETKFDPNGKPLCSFGTVQDITEEKNLQIEMERQRDEFKAIFNTTKDGIAILDAESNFLDFNDAYLEMIGYPRDELLKMNCIALSAPEDRQRSQEAMESIFEVGFIKGFEKRCIVKDGKELYINMTATLLPDKKRVLISTKDVSTMKEHAKELEYIAHYDALTGLPNRILEADRLHQGMVQAQRRKEHLAVVYLDLDGFKQVNDTYGHPVGDELLIGLSARMKQTLREGDTLCRLGGDEFVAILVDLKDTSSAIPIIDRLLEAASQPIELGDLTVQVSASIGVTFYPQEHEVDGDQLVRQADQAMYVAKQSGKNRYTVFDFGEDKTYG